MKRLIWDDDQIQKESEKILHTFLIFRYREWRK